jgi:hypothetical protein
MKETCDRCGPAVRAAYRTHRDNRELYFCRHCASQLSAALSARGWTTWLIEERALALQATQRTAPGSAIRVAIGRRLASVEVPGRYRRQVRMISRTGSSPPIDLSRTS